MVLVKPIFLANESHHPMPLVSWFVELFLIVRNYCPENGINIHARSSNQFQKKVMAPKECENFSMPWNEKFRLA